MTPLAGPTTGRPPARARPAAPGSTGSPAAAAPRSTGLRPPDRGARLATGAPPGRGGLRRLSSAAPPDRACPLNRPCSLTRCARRRRASKSLTRSSPPRGGPPDQRAVPGSAAACHRAVAGPCRRVGLMASSSSRTAHPPRRPPHRCATPCPDGRRALPPCPAAASACCARPMSPVAAARVAVVDQAVAPAAAAPARRVMPGPSPPGPGPRRQLPCGRWPCVRPCCGVRRRRRRCRCCGPGRPGVGGGASGRVRPGRRGWRVQVGDPVSISSLGPGTGGPGMARASRSSVCVVTRTGRARRAISRAPG